MEKRQKNFSANPIYPVSNDDSYEGDKFHLKIEISEEKIISLHTEILQVE